MWSGVVVLHEIEKETASTEYKNRRREYFSLQKSEGEYANKKLVYDIEKYILDHLHENINQQSLGLNFYDLSRLSLRQQNLPFAHPIRVPIRFQVFP